MVSAGRESVEAPAALRMRDSVLRKCDKRNGCEKTLFSPLESPLARTRFHLQYYNLPYLRLNPP